MVHSNRKSLRRDESGAVMAEGAVVLPVLVLILAGVYFLHDLHAARLHVARVARECAWQYCGLGCDPDKRSQFPQCSFSDQDSPGDLGAESERFETEMTKMAEKSKNSFDLIDVFGRQNTTSAGIERNRHRAFGRGTTNVSASMTLMCNEIPREPIEIVKDALCGLVPKLCP